MNNIYFLFFVLGLSLLSRNSFSFEKDNMLRSIKMKEETISIFLNKNGRVKTEVDFIFEGNMPEGFKMGFPENETIIYQNFKASFEGREVPVQRVFPSRGRLFDFKVARYSSAYSFRAPVNMVGEISHKITYEYNVPYYFEPGSKNEDSDDFFLEYIVKTGALWHKKIEKIVAYVHLGGITCSALKATATSLSGECVDSHTWAHKSFKSEPNKNIELIIDGSAITR